MLHKQSPGRSILAPRPGAGGHDLAGSEPEQRQQADKEAAPAHDPNLKNSKAPERYAPRPAVIFYGKKSCFPGRRGAYYLTSAVTTMKRTLVCFPRMVRVPSAVPMWRMSAGFLSFRLSAFAASLPRNSFIA